MRSLLSILLISIVFLSFSAGCTSTGSEVPSGPATSSLGETASDYTQQEAGRSLVGEVITAETEAKAPHLVGLSGNILLGNQDLQLVLAGANPRDRSQEWTPLVLRLYLWQEGKGWVVSPCFRDLAFKRNWTNGSLKAKTTTIIPSIDTEKNQAHIDIVYEIEPNKAAKKEFFQLWLRSNDPTLYLVTDHAQFEKNRKHMEARMSFRTFVKSDSSLNETVRERPSSFHHYAFFCGKEQWGILSSTPFQAQHSANDYFAFHTPGRNAMGWDGFAISFDKNVFRTMHLDSYLDQQCPPNVKFTVSESLEDYVKCRQAQHLPILTLIRPLGDLSTPTRCVKIQNEAKQNLTKVCFEAGEENIAIPLLPNETYYFIDDVTAQAWGTPAGVTLKDATSETIHLPVAPSNN